MIISRTPYRISFFGGGTDYPVWYQENGGAVLSTSIDKYAFISCRYLPPYFEHRSRVVYSRIELVDDNVQIEHPAVRETLRYMGVGEGIEVHYDGDMPARTGIGSSSSFTVGLLHALYALRGRMPTKQQLAVDAIRIEQQLIGENVGSQDQVAAAYGGFNYVTFNPAGNFEVTPLILPSDRMQEFSQHLLLVFTGFSRNASEIAASQVRATPNRRIELLAMRQMVDEGMGILTGDAPLAEFGSLLHEGWQLKRSLTRDVSTPAIDDIYAAARSAGALGGKLLGAGGGGFLLFFVQPELRARVIKRLEPLTVVPFQMDNTGSQIVVYQPTEPVQTQAARSLQLAA
ncbi:MAG: kinase [Chloroflexi bacterium]|nr:kinase [Chloroflexota bacterium]